MSTKVGSLEIELAANIARLQKDFADARAEVNKAVSGITGEVKKMQAEIESSMAKVGNAINVVNKAFVAVAVAAMGGKIVDSARHIAEYADEVDKSSQKTGIATDKLQGLQFAAKMSDLSAKDLDDSLKKLAKAMQGAGIAGNKGAEAFAAVGIKANELKNMKTEDALAKIADAFSKSKDGAGKAAIAMELFGKSGTEMIPFLNKGYGSINELIVQAQKLGVVLGGEALKGAGQLDDQFKLMDSQIDSLQQRASLAMVPAFLQITNAFSEASKSGGAMAGVFDGIGEVLILITKTVSYAAQAINAIGITIGATAAAVMRAVSGDFAAAAQIMKSGDLDIEESTRKFEAFRTSLEKPVNPPSAAKPLREGNGNLSLGGGGKAKAKADKSQMGDFKAELEGQHDSNSTQSLADDEAFWQAKLELVKRGSADERAVIHEIFAIRKEAAKKQMDEDLKIFQEQQKLDGLKIDRARDAALAQLDMQREQLTLAKSLGQIDDQQEIAALQKLEQQKYQIESKAVQDKIALEVLAGAAKE